MSATQDFVALDWIKTEISTILEQAQQSLERAVESADSASEMRACLSAVHQVHGTLKMVQIDGPMSIAKEMEELTESLMNNEVPDLSQAQEILMQSILQLPGYLDRIQREQKDNPDFVIPAINNLRIARGVEGIETQEANKTQDQFVLLTVPPSDVVVGQFEATGGLKTLRKLRQHYQRSLLALLKNNQVKENLVLIGKVFSKLIKTCGDSPLGNLSELGIALIEGVVVGAIKLDGNVVRNLKLVDAVLKSTIDNDSLATPIPDGLGQDIYEALKSGRKETPKITLALAKFHAESPQSDIKVESVEFGPDDDTLAAVSSILIEEIVKVTDSLDLYVRSSNRNSSDLFDLLPLLAQISSTLSVVGLTNHQESIVEQIGLIESIQSSGESPSEDQLLEIAGAFLEIQSDLAKVSGTGESGAETIGDLNEAQAAVIRETRNSLAKCKDALIDYVSSNFATENVEVLPEILRNLKGGLFIANQQRSAYVLEACANYVSEVLVSAEEKPSLGNMDDLADAITSIDYYLERYLESASDPYIQMIEVAEGAIEKLGYSVDTLAQQKTPNDTIITQSPEGFNQTVVQAPIEKAYSEEVYEEEIAEESEVFAEEKSNEPSDELSGESGGEEVPDAEEINVLEENLEQSQEPDDDDLIDDEIIEIFIEEAEEVLETIQTYLPQWQSDHGNEDARTEVRRAFHTLKGSGRMVGATVVGELAWSVENMLNRVIDNAIPLSDDLLSLVAEVVAVVPEGVEAFKNNNQDAFQTDALVSRVEALSSGELEQAIAQTEAPSAETEEPSAVIEEPSAEIEEPSAEIEEPSTIIEEPSAGIEDLSAELEAPSAEIELLSVEIDSPASDAEDSSVDLEEVSLEIEEPSARIEEPSARTEEPSASNKGPSASIEGPSAEAPPAETDQSLAEISESLGLLDETSDLEQEIESATESTATDNAEQISEEAFFEAFEEVDLEELNEVSVEPEDVIAQEAEEEAFFEEFEEIELEEFAASGEIEEPSAEIEEPSAEIEEPSAEVEELSAEMEELSAELKGPSAEAEQPSIEVGEPAKDTSEVDPLLEVENTVDDSEEAFFEEYEEIELEDLTSNDVVDSTAFAEEANASSDEETTSELESVDIVPDSIVSIESIEDTESTEDTEPDADEELDAIFKEEANENIEILRSYLASGEDVTPDVVAAYHTLKGSAGMAGVPVIAKIAAPLETHSNQLFVAGVEDDNFQRLVARSIELMDLVLADLSVRRDSLEELEGFLAQIGEMESQLEEIELPPVFEFDRINALSRQEGEVDSWDEERVDAIVEELKWVLEQALATSQDYLGELTSAMLSVYGQLDSKPPSVVSELLNRAHESLVIIFDHIASSQNVLVDDELVNQLCSIDIEALSAKEELRQFTKDGLDTLERCENLLVEWACEPNNLLPMEQICAALSQLEGEAESRKVNGLANQAEIILQLCEKLSKGNLLANEEDIPLLESGFAELQRQLECLDKTEQPESNDLVLSAFRNRLETTAISTSSTDDDSSRLPADEIEEDILPIFIEEAEELCEAIDESILAWSSDTSSTAHLDNLLRHLHTIKGGARLAGLNSLGEYTHNFETFLIGVQQNPTGLNDQFFTLLNRNQDEITRRVEIYNKVILGTATQFELDSLRNTSSESVAPSQSLPDDIDEACELVEKEEIQSVSLPEDDIDDDILAIFIEEAEELIESLDQSILDWSNNPNTNEHFDNLLRHLHTMKGGARLAGLNSLGEYTHNFETYLTGVQQNPVSFNDDFFAGLNKHQDEITRRVEIYKKRVQGEVSQEELQSLSEAELIPEPSGNQIASKDTPTAEAKEDKAPAIASPSTQAQEMVRVSADLLEDLISMSGEVNITRGRIEQQIRDFGESLQEMEETIDRIREQVRRLEIEAESRETVLRDRSGAGEGDSNFDELEMDRYTMLQEISRTLNESSSDMAGLKDTLVNKSRDAETLLHQQARIGSELQEGLTRTRMVPISRLIPRLRRIVRQVSAEVGKSVRFDAFNVEGELDRNVLERIVAPLEHMLRNAVDHGIESAEKRKAANKPETGRISMRLSREGGYVLLTISDDGGGINIGVVKNKAIERGIITKDSDVSDQDVMQFIMHAGFSTAAQLTQISGRGVGMDVVTSEIKQLGGSVTIDSTLHVGTEFTIRIPFTVSINRALMVVVKDETFAVPLNTIEGIVRVSPYELEAYYQPDAPMFEYAGQPYRLNYMGEMLNKKGGPILEGQVALMPVILARSGDDSVALQVDRVIGSREVVVKSLGPQFNEVGGISGATVLGDGSVVIILDVMALVRNHEDRQKENEDKPEIEKVETVNQARKIMIVDDSVTVRKVTTRLMERQGWEVTTAKDGVDAINQLQDYYPDIMLLDIEMPKMDGFGVLRAVRRDPRLEGLPIIMITSRTGEKHKQQAFELGVNQYLGKPFQEANLISTIETVIESVNKETKR